MRKVRVLSGASYVFGYSAWLTRPIGAGNDMIVKAFTRGTQHDAAIRSRIFESNAPLLSTSCATAALASLPH